MKYKIVYRSIGSKTKRVYWDMPVCLVRGALINSSGVMTGQVIYGVRPLQVFLGNPDYR